MGSKTGALMGAACLLAAVGVRAQAVDVDGQPVGCGCHVEITSVAAIEGDFVGLGNLVLAVDPVRGLLFTTNSDWRDRVLVYDIGQDSVLREPVSEIGRAGDGPGEFRNVVGLALLQDSLVVLSSRPGRISIFGPDHAF